MKFRNLLLPVTINGGLLFDSGLYMYLFEMGFGYKELVYYTITGSHRIKDQFSSTLCSTDTEERQCVRTQHGRRGRYRVSRIQ